MAAAPFVFVDQPAWSFGRRGKVRHGEDTPGPGAYETTKPLMGVRDTIHMKRNGQYRPQVVRKKRIDEYLNNGPNRVPGPGDYNIPTTFDHTNKKESAWAYGRGNRSLSGRSLTTDDVPGPGSYLSQNNHNAGCNGTSFGGRRTTPRKPLSFLSGDGSGPGPGEYYHPWGTSSYIRSVNPSAWAASRTSRLAPKSAWGPGPGEYDPQPNNKIAGPVYYGSSSSQKCLTPTRSQQGRLGKEASPGPGAYESPHHTAPNGPKYSFQGRPRGGLKSEVPGPGSYDIGHSPGGPRYSMAARVRSGDHKLATDFTYDVARNRAGMSTNMGRHEFAHHSYIAQRG